MQILEALLSKDGIDLVAEPITAPVRDGYSQLNDWTKVAQELIEKDPTTDVKDLPKIPDIHQVMELVARLKKSVALVTGMLANIAKAQGLHM